MGLSTIRDRVRYLRERAEYRKQLIQEQIERGRQRTLDIQVKKEERRQKKLMQMKPGARRAITEGILAKKSPLDVMKEEYWRRKYEREQKNKQ